MVHLNNIWFVIIAIFWVGFFILEGFDFGVGMLHSFVGKDDVERRIAVNSIGPDLGRERDVARRGGSRDLRRVPVVVRHHVLHPLPGHGDRPAGPDRPRGLLRVQPQDRQPAVAHGLEVVAHRRAARSSRSCSAPPSATSSTGCPSTPPTTTPATSSACCVPYGLYTGLTVTVLCLFVGAAYLTLKTDGRAARSGGSAVGPTRLAGRGDHLRLGDLEPCRAQLGLRAQAHRRAGARRGASAAPGWPRRAQKGWAFAAAATAIGERGGVDLLRALPAGDGVQHELGLQPHGRPTRPARRTRSR